MKKYTVTTTIGSLVSFFDKKGQPNKKDILAKLELLKNSEYVFKNESHN